MDVGDDTSGFKRCPKCAEEVRSEAQICRFCGFDFSRSRKRSRGRMLVISPAALVVVAIAALVVVLRTTGSGVDGVDGAADLQPLLEEVQGIASCSAESVGNFGEYLRCDTQSGGSVIAFFFKSPDVVQRSLELNCAAAALGTSLPTAFYEPGATWYVGVADDDPAISRDVSEALDLDPYTC